MANVGFDGDQGSLKSLNGHKDLKNHKHFLTLNVFNSLNKKHRRNTIHNGSFNVKSGSNDVLNMDPNFDESNDGSKTPFTNKNI